MRPWPLVISLSVFVLLFLLCLAFRGVEISRPPGWLPRCALYQLTGIHCPGCGNTRAAYALLHGDVAEALRQNAFSVIALPFFLVFAASLISAFSSTLENPVEKSEIQT